MLIQPAIKAAVSFSAGIFITFSQSHSPEVGLYTLAVYGLIVGLSSVAFAFGRKTEGALQELPMATLATLIGIFAFLAARSRSGGREGVCQSVPDSMLPAFDVYCRNKKRSRPIGRLISLGKMMKRVSFECLIS